MGGDCKSPGSAFEGSNPSPATSNAPKRGVFAFEESASDQNLASDSEAWNHESNA